MLDEVALRKPGGRFDVEVKLGGQVWHLPKPRVTLGLRRGPDGAREVETRSGFGIEFDDMLRAYEDSLDRPGSGTILAMFDLAAAMLKTNYTLSDDDLESLLAFTPDDPESVATWQLIVATARGQTPDPKATGPGDEPGS